jgi:hypothetical protein
MQEINTGEPLVQQIQPFDWYRLFLGEQAEPLYQLHPAGPDGRADATWQSRNVKEPAAAGAVLLP